jgi:hypothetical protein
LLQHTKISIGETQAGRRNPESNIMNIKEALQKEINYLDNMVRRSLEHSEKAQNFSLGSIYRQNLRDWIASYKRILKSLDE